MRGLIRRLALTVEVARMLDNQKFRDKIDEWSGSSWALEEAMAGHLHHVEFVLDNSGYDRDGYSEAFLKGARQTLISMMMAPEAATYVRAWEAAHPIEG